jgi:hypothetical protein
MRRLVLVLAFAAFAFAANSQLTIRPQAGLENSNTKISYNKLPYFSPMTQLQPQLSLRADYKFKNGFGPFAGVSTSRSLVSYNFNNPENGMTAYRAALGKMLLQLQAGLQYTTRPLVFNRKSSPKSSKTSSSEKTTSSCSHYSSGCSHYSSSCCTRKSNTEQKIKSQNQKWSLRMQPSAGFGFTPSSRPDLVTKSSLGYTDYTYNAGNNKTALLTGLGFEFARNKTKFFTLSVNYFKGLGDNETTFTSQAGGKTTTTILNSKLSGWNASIGIPISFTKNSYTKHKTEQRTKYDCQQYRIEYKYRCRKTI